MTETCIYRAPGLKCKMPATEGDTCKVHGETITMWQVKVYRADTLRPTPGTYAYLTLGEANDAAGEINRSMAPRYAMIRRREVPRYVLPQV